jgi:hypothetical protein
MSKGRKKSKIFTEKSEEEGEKNEDQGKNKFVCINVCLLVLHFLSKRVKILKILEWPVV